MISSESIKNASEEENEEEAHPVKIDPSEHHPPRYKLSVLSQSSSINFWISTWPSGTARR